MIYNDPMIWLKSKTDPPVYTTVAPTLAASNTWYKGTTAKNTLTSINIVDGYMPTGNETEWWNADVDDTGTIKCYVTGTELVIAINGAGSIKCNADSSYMFSETDYFNRYAKVTTISGLELLDTSSVTDMYSMFQNCSKLTTLDLSSFDTSSVTSMSNMFYNCSSLTSLDLSSFNTSSVRIMYYMFYSCSSLASLDLSGFNTSSVLRMDYMFYRCSSLTSLDLSSFNTSSVTVMNYMFYTCSSLTSLDLSSFDTSSVINMGYMFYKCSALTTIYASSLWSTAKVTNSSNMFNSCTNLVGDIPFNSSYIDKTYARTSGGYLTYKAA